MTRHAVLPALLLATLACAGCGGPSVNPDPLQVYKRPGSKQEQIYWKGRTDLIRTPAVQPVQALKLPPLRRFQLENQLSVLLVPDHQLPLVDVQLLLRSGAIDDPPATAGLAEFTANMLRQGTQRMSADRISETVDMAGAGLAAESDYEVTSIRCRARSKSIALCLQMVADLAMHPTFPDKEMGEIRDRLLSGVKNMRDDPETLAAVHFDAMLFGDDHPAGRVKTETSVRGISRKNLVQFHGAHYRPDIAILGVSGDIDPTKMEQAIRAAFGSWQAPGAHSSAACKPAQDPPAGLRVLLVDKPDLSQSFFSMGHAGITRKAPDRDAVSVMNYILGGGGFSSRLMQVIRAKGGKTYGITSHFYRAAVDGSFVVQSFTRNDQLLATLDLARQELNRIRQTPPTRVELDAAKGKIAGGFPIKLKTAAVVTNKLMLGQLWGLPDTEVVEFPVRIQRLTTADTARAARQHVRPDHLVAAVVGKASEVAPLLRKAKIQFEQISYLEPVSAHQREALKQKAEVSVTPAQMKAARKVLDRALQAAGGRRRLASIRSLRLRGEAKVTAKGQTLAGVYTAQILLPDHMRLGVALKVGIGMVQVLAGDRAWLQVGPQRKDLPLEVVARWKAQVWREPVLLPLHAASKGVRARIAVLPGLPASRVAIELFPDKLPAATVIIERRSARIVEVRHVDRTGATRVTRLSGHRKVKGVLVPHHVTSTSDGREQAVEYDKVEINPALAPRDITAGS